MIVLPLLLVLGGTVVWSRALKREVALRTAALEREVAERRRAMDELEVRQRQLIQADKMTRITSYNVCYTKLLRAARLAGVPRRTFYRMLSRHGLSGAEFQKG